jgi:hypothetical protein
MRKNMIMDIILVISLLAYFFFILESHSQAGGHESSLEFDTDRYGLDYRSFDLPQADPRLCMEKCAADKKCKAWTYVKPNSGQGPRPRCWLKHDVPPPIPNKCCISGVKIKSEKRDNKEISFLTQLCMRGDMVGCNNLGFLYQTGQGVKKDYSRAAQLYEKSCNGGNAHGCFNLGLLYKTGTGVAQDYSRATALFRKAVKLDKSIEKELKKRGVQLGEEPKKQAVTGKKNPSQHTKPADDLGEL